MKLTLISHFYNEEFLLPFWLRHHRNLFDHGIMINYQSTDASCDIIKELVPEWELINTRNTEGWVHPAKVDEEVMDLENGVEGWKMALNTTEFLFHWNLKQYLKGSLQLELTQCLGVRTQGIVMIDKPEQKNVPVDFNKPLYAQRTYGYFEGSGPNQHGWSGQGRQRLLHRFNNGAYEIGRHSTKHIQVFKDPNLYLLWYNYSPFLHMMPRGISYRTKQWNDLYRYGGMDEVRKWGANRYDFMCEEQSWHDQFARIHRECPVQDMMLDQRFKEVYDNLNIAFL
jgi:hypothetical protein